MTLDLEFILLVSVLFTVVSCEISDYRKCPSLSVALVQSFILSAILNLVFVSADQRICFYVCSAIIYIGMGYLYVNIQDAMTKLFKKFYVLDIGIFQAATAMAIYKYV